MPGSDAKAIFLLPKLQEIDDRYSFGIVQKRISLEEAKEQFISIQHQHRMNWNGVCNISSKMVLLPKAFVHQHHSISRPMLNHVLKKSFWGGCYVIEFFDEKKIFSFGENERSKIDIINKKIKDVIDIDLAKVSDRIGNVVFQFPITIFTLNILLTKEGYEVRTVARSHVKSESKKNVNVVVRTSLDNVITGFDIHNFNSLNFELDSTLGDDYNVHITVSDCKNKVLLYDDEVNFLKSVHTTMLAMGLTPPRTIPLGKGLVEQIDLACAMPINVGHSLESDYNNQILERSRNDEVIKKSGDYKVFKSRQSKEALDFIRNKIKQTNAKEICLWDPYLSAQDIMNTLYYEPTGKMFRCITCASSANSISAKEGNLRGFDKLCEESKEAFKQSNNLNVNMKFLAQHDDYGWKFHDRFLIFVPYESTQLPEAYSLGISVNQIGGKHHIIQKVTDSREILKNFEDLWKELDNEECCVVEFPRMVEML